MIKLAFLRMHVQAATEQPSTPQSKVSRKLKQQRSNGIPEAPSGVLSAKKARQATRKQQPQQDQGKAHTFSQGTAGEGEKGQKQSSAKRVSAATQPVVHKQQRRKTVAAERGGKAAGAHHQGVQVPCYSALCNGLFQRCYLTAMDRL